MKTNVLPAGFRFSQSNLVDYGECKRRFLLRYVKDIDWPAPVTSAADEYEAAIERGQRFHRLVHQAALGLDVSDVVEGSDDALLKQWWHNYQHHPPALPAGSVFSEIEVSVPLGDYRLVAKFDRFIVTEDGRVVIVDWKTGRRRPDQDQLRASWQTVVYRYVAVEGSSRLANGRPIAPEQVSLIYWHAAYPDSLEPIGYSQTEHAEARRRLEGIVAEIEAFETDVGFAKTDDWSLCRRCEFRSYCGRGRVAGDEWEIREERLEFDVIPEGNY